MNTQLQGCSSLLYKMAEINAYRWLSIPSNSQLQIKKKIQVFNEKNPSISELTQFNPMLSKG